MDRFTLLPLPIRTEPEKVDDWLVKCKDDTEDTIRYLFAGSAAFSTFSLTGHVYVSYSANDGSSNANTLAPSSNDVPKTNTLSPSTVLIIVFIGTYLLAWYAGYLIVNGFQYKNFHPMQKRKYRALFGAYYATMFTLPVVAFLAWFVPPDFLWVFGVAIVCPIWNSYRCAFSDEPAFVDEDVEAGIVDDEGVGFFSGLGKSVRNGLVGLIGCFWKKVDSEQGTRQAYSMPKAGQGINDEQLVVVTRVNSFHGIQGTHL